MTGHAAVERMTVAAFLDWASRRPEGERWELIEGEPVPVRGPAPVHAMAADTVMHARIKRRIDHALGAALAKGGHVCEVFVSDPKVQIDADTQRRLVVHHHRLPGEQEFRTRIARTGTLRLDPPGLDLDLDAIYAGTGM